MAITGDRYIAAYHTITIELVRNNWDKTLTLFVDGVAMARASRVLPRNLTLTAAFELNGATHTVIARSVVRFLRAEDTIEVDGQAMTLIKVQ